MHIKICISIFLITQLITRVMAAHIGLFSSTGCYSHDMLMRNLADRLTTDGHHRVTIIQIRVFEFNRTLPAPKSEWKYISFDSISQDSTLLQERSQRLMWLTTLPFDGDTFDPESVRILARIHRFHMRSCFRALRNAEFVGRIQALDLDLLVIDYLLNECAAGLAYAFNKHVNIVYLSNYPVVSSYVDNMGLSSNPSYVPTVIGAETVPMNFGRRTFNSVMYGLLVETRRRFYANAKRTFKLAADIPLPDLAMIERRTLMFATPFEMLLDTPRPMVSGLRYFGCEHCLETGVRENITRTLSLPEARSGFILVSFGTVTKGDLIPMIQLQRLFRTFSQFPQYTIIWQLDASKEYIDLALLRSTNSTLIPDHIHIYPWIPLKSLLNDQRVVLLVSHGGVTTCIEAVNSGVPVLGVAIQGDQLYNLQRFAEKGVGEFLQVSKLNEYVLREKMSKMIVHNGRYKQAALKLRSMLRDYKMLEKSPSVFWLGWATRHFSTNGTESRKWSREYIYSKHSSNWLFYYGFDAILVLVSIIVFLIIWVYL